MNHTHALLWETTTTWGRPLAVGPANITTQDLEPPSPEGDVVVSGQHHWEPYTGGLIATYDGVVRWTAWRRPRLVVLEPQLGLAGLETRQFESTGMEHG